MDPTAPASPLGDDLDDALDPDERPPPWWQRLLTGVVLPVLGALVLVQAVGWLRAPALPELAPEVQARTPEGEAIRLADHRGRTVVLNFWATWCGPCRLEAPSFDAFAEANPEVVVLGLASDRDPALVRRTADQLGMRYPVAIASPETLRAYGVTTYPTTVVVGPDGRVRAAHTGLLLRPQLWALTQL